MYKLELGGVRAKVDRAHEGLRNLETDIETRCADERCRLETEIPRNAFSLPDPEGPQTLHGYSVLVGEVAYNLRSALDHLVWQLALANGATSNPRNEFPIFHERDLYRKKVKAKLRGLSERHCAMIESFQPFWKGGCIGPHLRMLHAICNIDKHRHLNVVDMHTIASAYPDGEIPAGLLPPGMTGGLALYSYLKGNDQRHLVKPRAVVDVCFMDTDLEEASPGYGSEFETAGINKRPPVIPVLKACLDAVVGVVEQLTGESVEGGGSWSSGNALQRKC